MGLPSGLQRHGRCTFEDEAEETRAVTEVAIEDGRAGWAAGRWAVDDVLEHVRQAVVLTVASQDRWKSEDGIGSEADLGSSQRRTTPWIEG
jgi:hypothetical protein